MSYISEHSYAWGSLHFVLCLLVAVLQGVLCSTVCVCIYTHTYLYIHSHSLCLMIATTTLQDMAQVIQPAVDAAIYQWPYTDLTDAWCSECISSHRLNSIGSPWRLSETFTPYLNCSSLQSAVFWLNCFSIHRYQQNP